MSKEGLRRVGVCIHGLNSIQAILRTDDGHVDVSILCEAHETNRKLYNKVYCSVNILEQ